MVAHRHSKRDLAVNEGLQDVPCRGLCRFSEHDVSCVDDEIRLLSVQHLDHVLESPFGTLVSFDVMGVGELKNLYLSVAVVFEPVGYPVSRSLTLVDLDFSGSHGFHTRNGHRCAGYCGCRRVLQKNSSVHDNCY